MFFSPREKSRFAALPIMVLWVTWLRQDFMNYWITWSSKKRISHLLQCPVLSLGPSGNHGSCIIKHNYREMCLGEGIGHCWTIPEIKACVQIWCPSTVSENDFWWALMWTHLFSTPRQNSGTVPLNWIMIYRVRPQCLDIQHHFVPVPGY